MFGSWDAMPPGLITESKGRGRNADFLLAELRRIRQSRGLSLNQVARAAGFSRNDIRRWEHGQHVPSVLNFQAVINALGYELRLVRRDEAASDEIVSSKG
jgi:transcriptional regulator with XRE-family HTH domain